MYKFIISGLLASLAMPSLAQRVSEASNSTHHQTSYLNLFQVFFALVFIIALLLVFAWLMKKFNPNVQSNKIPMKIVGGLNLGTKEKIVIIEMGEEWLVLGITSQQINTLHHLPKQNLPTENLPSNQLKANFSDRLNKIMQNKKS